MTERVLQDVAFVNDESFSSYRKWAQKPVQLASKYMNISVFAHNFYC